MKKKLTVILSVLAVVLAACLLVALLLNSCQPETPNETDPSQTGTAEQTTPSTGVGVEIELPNDEDGEDGEDGEDDIGYPYVDSDVQGSGDNAVTPTTKPTQPQDPEATGDGEDDPYAPEDSGKGDEDGEDGGNSGSQGGDSGNQDDDSKGDESGSQSSNPADDDSPVAGADEKPDISVDFGELGY